MRPTWTPCKRLSSGKRAWGACIGQQVPPSTVSPQDVNVITVAAVKTKAATILGKIGGSAVEMMLDSGSSVSLIRRDVIAGLQGIRKIPESPSLRLVTASGEPLVIVEHIQATVCIGNLEIAHNFIVVDRLITPVILGIDFLRAVKACHCLLCARPTTSQLVGLYRDVTPYLPHTSHGRLAARSQF